MTFKRLIAAFVLAFLVSAAPAPAQTVIHRDAEVDEVLHLAATATADGVELQFNAVKDLVVYIDWAATTDGGGVTIEETHTTGDVTTWEAIGSEETFLDDEMTAISLGRRYWRTLRVRISTTVTTGTVTVRVVGR